MDESPCVDGVDGATEYLQPTLRYEPVPVSLGRGHSQLSSRARRIASRLWPFGYIAVSSTQGARSKRLIEA